MGANRVSPGEQIDYVVEYRNDGAKAADEALVLAIVHPPIELIETLQVGIL